MPIGRLDHYSIRTLDIEALRLESLALHHVFFEDPSPVTIELDYPAHPAAA